MSLTLSELPIDVLRPIFNLLDHKSLLAMRKVCDTTKQTVEATVLNGAKSLLIGCLKIEEEVRYKLNRCSKEFIQVDGKVFIGFSFDRLDEPSRLSSKMHLVSALNCLRVPVFTFNTKDLNLLMTISYATTLLDSLAALVGGATCTILEVSPSTPKMFHLVSKFVKEAPELFFKVDDSKLSRSFLLEIIDQIHSAFVRLEINSSLPKNYLFELAQKVDGIAISSRSDSWMFGYDPISLSASENLNARYHQLRDLHIESMAADILEQRCSYLDLTNASVSVHSPKLISIYNKNSFYFSAVTSRMEQQTAYLIARRPVVSVTEDRKNPERNIMEISLNMKRRE